jgi:hypothetical protein
MQHAWQAGNIIAVLQSHRMEKRNRIIKARNSRSYRISQTRFGHIDLER